MHAKCQWDRGEGKICKQGKTGQSKFDIGLYCVTYAAVTGVGDAVAAVLVLYLEVICRVGTLLIYNEGCIVTFLLCQDNCNMEEV